MANAPAATNISSVAQTRRGDSVTHGKSWSDDIQRYHAAKATLPWSPEQQTPVKHVTRFEKAREEREYDLVLGKFRDAEREVSRVRQERDQLEGGLELARTVNGARSRSQQAKQLRNVQRFNVVNHAPMFPGATDPKDAPSQPHPYRAKIAPEFNIVTNLSTNKTSAHPERAESSASPNQPRSRRPTREFNILTNQYHESHEAKAEADAAKRKEVAATKYFKTRSFDPVRITFVDEQRELAFLQDREQQQQAHGKDRALQLPPREQFSEGRLYNILNQRVINADKIGAATEKDERALNKMQKAAFEAKMHALGDALLATETARCLNRYAHERHTQSYVHGYDPISNESFGGRAAKPMMPTRTHAALSAWQVLETGVQAGAKVSSPHNPAKQSESPRVALSAKPSASNDRHSFATLSRSNILVLGGGPSDTDSAASASPAPTRVRTGGFSSR
ncbi:hypothetical protein PybrP1_006649 [[Pythium] brassicae (nom. inval.)]|nr:hypothetical protein PybrP1_006649 [[Pythium] brassicae (nom. inval.)]